MFEDQFLLEGETSGPDEFQRSGLNSAARVRRVQEALNTALGSNIPPDGMMNSRTRRALRRFQRMNGILDDGRLSRETAAALDPEFSYEGEWDHEGGGGGPTVRCSDYMRGELERSNTEAGHLPADFFTAPSGNEVIADFPVGSSRIRNSIRRDSNLKNRVQQLMQIAATDATARVRIVGYTDCVNKENRNARLRADRAKQVFALIQNLAGRDPRWPTLKSRISVVGAPLDQYIVDNSNPTNRATNRGVVIELVRSVSFEPEHVCDNRIKTVTVWLNAFIPREVKGLTHSVPASKDPTMAGKTMLKSLGVCLLTDQRGFSIDRQASARMHSEAKIDLDKPGIVDQHHWIQPTIQVACSDGKTKCKKRSAVPAGTKFTWVGVTSDKELMVKLAGSQGPACPGAVIRAVGKFLFDGKIDYNGTFTVKRTTKNGRPLKNYVDIGFLGHVDLFPAYEFVVQLNDSNPVHLGGVLPDPGSSPVTHIGTKQQVHFLIRLWLKCENGKRTAAIDQRIISRRGGR